MTGRDRPTHVVHDASLWWDAIDLPIERVADYAAARAQLAAPRLSVESPRDLHNSSHEGGQIQDIQAAMERLMARGWANRWRKSYVYQPPLSNAMKRAVRLNRLSRPSMEAQAFFKDVTQGILTTLVPNKAFDLDEAFSQPFAFATTEALMGIHLPPMSGADVLVLNALGKRPDMKPELLVDSIPVLKSFYDHVTEAVRTQNYTSEGILAAFIEVQKDLHFGEESLVMSTVAVTSASLLYTVPLNRILKRLCSSPELIRILQDDPREVPAIVEELLRLCPSADVLTVLSFRPDGCPMATEIHVEEANHDPSVFENPSEVTLGRLKPPHLSFGYGHRACDGMQTARTSLAVALPMIAAQLQGLRLVSEGDSDQRVMAIFDAHA